MKDVFARRLASARKLAGLSMRQLSEGMNGLISHNAIAKYERGEMLPDSKILIELGKFLHVKPDYFFRPFTTELTNVEFRKGKNLNAKQTDLINVNVSDAVARYLELESFLSLDAAFKNPIKKLQISNGDDVEQAVLLLLKEWRLGINALPNVIELLEEKEVKVIELTEHGEFDGLSGWANGTIPVIVVNKGFTIERKRFTALHELGHLLLTIKEGLSEKEIEKLCHRFAGAMLMPSTTFINELGEKRTSISISELIAIKEKYGISIQAIMARAKDLGVIADATFVKFRNWINKDESRLKEIGLGAYLGSEHSHRFTQLLHRATAEEIISMSKAANLANVKLATFRDEYIAV